MNPRVKTVTPQSDFTLLIGFSSGEKKVFDVKPYLDRGVFSELKNLDLFMKATPALGTVVWPNELDFCPDTVYLEGKDV